MGDVTPYNISTSHGMSLWGDLKIGGVKLPLRWFVTLGAVALIHLLVFYGLQMVRAVEYTPNPIGANIIPVAYLNEANVKQPEIEPKLVTSLAPPKTRAGVVTPKPSLKSTEKLITAAIVSDENNTPDALTTSSSLSSSQDVSGVNDLTPQDTREEGLSKTRQDINQTNNSPLVGTHAPVSKTGPVDKTIQQKVLLSSSPNKFTLNLGGNQFFDPRDNLQRQSCSRQARSVDLRIDKEARPCARFSAIVPSLAKFSGYCRARYKVLHNGRPSQITINNCSDPVFEKNSLKAVSGWYFIPEVKNGERVDSEFRETTLRYNLIDKFGVSIEKQNNE